MAELNTIITLRQGTTAEWEVSTVRLREGEMGLEYLADGTVKIKAGILGDDGQGKLWADLPYIGSDVKAANIFQVELAEGEVDDIAAIEAQVALENAENLFFLNNIEKDIILRHMWPITFSTPKYLETFIVTFVDKYCAIKEFSNYCKYTMWSWYLNWFYI